jgi:hypothetical protein
MSSNKCVSLKQGEGLLSFHQPNTCRRCWQNRQRYKIRWHSSFCHIHVNMLDSKSPRVNISIAMSQTTFEKGHQQPDRDWMATGNTRLPHYYWMADRGIGISPGGFKTTYPYPRTPPRLIKHWKFLHLFTRTPSVPRVFFEQTSTQTQVLTGSAHVASDDSGVTLD